MNHRLRAFCAAAACALLVIACGGDRPEPATPTQSRAATESAGDTTTRKARGRPAPSQAYASGQLDGLVDTYFQQNLKLNPLTATFIGDHRYDDKLGISISPAHRARQLELERKFLDALVVEVDKSALEGQDLLTYEVFELGRRTAIEGLGYPSHLLPINQFFSVPNLFATLASGTSAHPFNTVRDYDNMLSRIGEFSQWIDQAIENMRTGMREGIVAPRIVMEKVLPQLQAHIADDVTQTVFWRPVMNLPDSFSAAERERLTGAYRKAISETLIPTYERLHAFIADEYLPATRASVGLSALPGGREWYDYLVRLQTTTDLSAEEIHAIGLAEVERIAEEMLAVRNEVGFDGDLPAFFEHLRTDPQFYHDTGEQLVQSYRDLKATLDAAAPELFELMPRADFEVRAVEPFREQSASGAFYMRPAPDGSRPGVFYVNTYNIKSRPKYAAEALYLHEAVPGHHFQISLQQELEELPDIRRFGGFTAYIEGWGLYAESLGEELGLYTDPYQRFGALDAEMVRSIRLVLDTGIHAKGWTREQALEFMMSNSSISETRAVAEVERYIAVPGQALAYKIGQLKIAELRARAEEALGERFDIKAFHAEVLADGALPLDVLEAKIDRWIESQQA